MAAAGDHPETCWQISWRQVQDARNNGLPLQGRTGQEVDGYDKV